MGTPRLQRLKMRELKTERLVWREENFSDLAHWEEVFQGQNFLEQER
jgi:hypothetical protein